MPGGLPCSFSSLSAFPRLIDGVGDGFFVLASACEEAMPGVVVDGRKSFSDEDVLITFADADGRRTCSAQELMSAMFEITRNARGLRVGLR
jgi:hypothetical protein